MIKILAVLLMFNVTAVFGLTLDEARAKGLVEELDTGYLKAKDTSAKELESSVNEKRKAHYEKIAKQTGVGPDQVAKQAAKKIQAKLKK